MEQLVLLTGFPTKIISRCIAKTAKDLEVDEKEVINVLVSYYKARKNPSFLIQPWGVFYETLLYHPDKDYISFLRDQYLMATVAFHIIYTLDYSSFLPSNCTVKLQLWETDHWNHALAQPKVLKSQMHLVQPLTQYSKWNNLWLQFPKDLWMRITGTNATG